MWLSRVGQVEEGGRVCGILPSLQVRREALGLGTHKAPSTDWLSLQTWLLCDARCRGGHSAAGTPQGPPRPTTSYGGERPNSSQTPQTKDKE